MSNHASLSPALLELLTKAASHVQHLERHFPEHKENAHTLINNPDLKEFWQQAAALVRPGLAEDFITGLLEIMALKGGYMPEENVGVKRKRRSRLGQRVKGLRLALKQDEILADLSLAELMDMTGNEHIAKVLAFKEPRYDERARDPFVGATARYVLDEFGPSLLEILAEFEKRLVGFQSVNEWDKTEERQDPLMPPPGQQRRRQIRTERLLCRHFTRYTGSPQVRLVAMAICVIFCDEVDSSAVTKRCNEFIRRGG